MLVEIKCPYSGNVPTKPSIEHYLQCMCHMHAHSMENCILIYYTPTTLVFYVIKFNVKVWQVLQIPYKYNLEYFTNCNKMAMKLLGQDLEPTDQDDTQRLVNYLSKSMEYTMILEYVQHHAFSYDENIFPTLTIHTIQSCVQIPLN